MEYASNVWGPSIKHLHRNRDINFSCREVAVGRDSVTEALEKLNVQRLGDRCETSKHKLFLRLSSSGESHGLLIGSYD